MDKKKKILFIGLVIILIALTVIGVLSFISYSNNKNTKDDDWEVVDIDPDSGEPYAYGVTITSSDDFINTINEQMIGSIDDIKSIIDEAIDEIDEY